MTDQIAPYNSYYPKVCKHCQHWVPRYRGVGVCTQEGTSSAAFWTIGGDNSRLLTLAEFGCVSFRQVEDTSKSTL
jgi:hypothetical protein